MTLMISMIVIGILNIINFNDISLFWASRVLFCGSSLWQEEFRVIMEFDQQIIKSAKIISK